MNRYPKHLMGRTLRHKPKSLPAQQDKNIIGNIRGGRTQEEAVLSYVRGVSEKIERLCHPLAVEVVCKSQNILRQTLMKVEAAKPDKLKKGVMYEVPCGECNCMYVGETG